MRAPRSDHGGPENFGLDPISCDWPDLPPEIRRQARGYRAEMRKQAKRDAFDLPKKIPPGIWWTWTSRMWEMGYPHPHECSPERALEKVESAVAKGRLVLSTSCAACGLERSLEPYHYDYRRPLAVVWVCAECRARQRSSGTTIVVV